MSTEQADGSSSLQARQDSEGSGTRTAPGRAPGISAPVQWVLSPHILFDLWIKNNTKIGLTLKGSRKRGRKPVYIWLDTV